MYVIKPKGGMIHEKVDRIVSELEKTEEGPVFDTIGNVYSRKVKSFATEEEKVIDVHYGAIYNTSKKAGCGHKLNPGVYQHPIAVKEPVQKPKTASIVPVQAAVSSMVQQAAAAMRTQVITAPAPVAMDITAVAMAAMRQGNTMVAVSQEPAAEPMVQETTTAPFVEHPRAPIDTDEILREMTRNMDDLRVAQERGSVAATENERLKERCAELEEANAQLTRRVNELEGVLPEFAGARGLVSRIKFLEGRLEDARRMGNVMVLRLRRQERRLFLILHIISLQHIDDMYLGEFKERLMDAAKVPKNGTDEPYLELGWLLKNCQSVEECRKRLSDVTDLNDLLLQPPEGVVLRLSQDNAALKAQVELLRGAVASMEQRPRDQYVPLHVYDSARDELARQKRLYANLEKETKLDTHAFIGACMARLMAYYDRENRVLEDAAFKVIDNDNLKAVLEVLATENQLSVPKVEKVVLASKIEELKKAFKGDFITKMTERRTVHMNEFKYHVEVLEQVKARKNAVIMDLHTEVQRMERACGVTRKEATAMDVSQAQHEYNRICASIRAIRDDEALQASMSGGVIEEFNRHKQNLGAIAKEVRTEETKLEAAKAGIVEANLDYDTVLKAVKDMVGQHERLRGLIADIKNGEDGKRIRESVKKTQDAEDQYKLLQAEIARATEEYAGIKEAIQETEDERKVLEKEVQRLQAQQDVVMA